MNATATPGVWVETFEDKKLVFDTTTTPQTITVHRDGRQPVPFSYDVITVNDVTRLKSVLECLI